MTKKLRDNFVSNRKLYHKPVKDVRGEKGGQARRIRDKDGTLLTKDEEVANSELK